MVDIFVVLFFVFPRMGPFYFRRLASVCSSQSSHLTWDDDSASRCTKRDLDARQWVAAGKKGCQCRPTSENSSLSRHRMTRYWTAFESRRWPRLGSDDGQVANEEKTGRMKGSQCEIKGRAGHGLLNCHQIRSIRLEDSELGNSTQQALAAYL